MDGVLLQRTDHFEAGPVADVSEARVTVTTKIALQNQSIFRAVEERPPFFEFKHAVRRLLGVDLRHAPLIQ